MQSFTYLNPPIRHEFLGVGRIAVPRNTAYKMRDEIRKASGNPYIRAWAEHIVSNVPDRDEAGEVQAIYDFIRRNVRYAHDPRELEWVMTPPYLLKQIEIGMKPSADCDDHTVLSLSLLRSLGYPTVIRVAGYDPITKRFGHVYGLVQIQGRWVPFDAVRKDKPLGWEAPSKQAVMDIPVDQQAAGVGGLGEAKGWATPADALTSLGIWGSFASIGGLILALAMLAKSKV